MLAIKGSFYHSRNTNFLLIFTKIPFSIKELIFQIWCVKVVEETRRLAI